MKMHPEQSANKSNNKNVLVNNELKIYYLKKLLLQLANFVKLKI